MNRIFITGCAKSGTTLLKRLFYAFADVEIVPGEQHITQFCRKQSEAGFLVGKRHRFSLFSEHLPLNRIEQFINLVAAHDVKVVNVVRDGRDVIFSDHQNVAPRRWVASMRQRRQYAHLLSAEIRYEDVISNADQVQAHLVEVLGLQIDHPWSDYPAFVPDHEFGGGIYGKRPLDARSIQKGLDHQAVIDDINLGFDEELRRAGYVRCPMDDFYRRHGAKVHSGRPRHETIAGLVEGPVVLDVACGTGDLLLLLQNRDDLILHGTDISPVALEMAEARGVKATLHCLDGLPALTCDTIVMSQVLEHIDDDRGFIDQARQRLRPGGLLIVTVPRGNEVRSPKHKRQYTEETLDALLKRVGNPVLHSWPGERYRLLMTVRNE